MTTVLMLGATGNLCSATADLLTQHAPAITLRLASSRPTGCEKLQARYPAADVIQADWYDLNCLMKAFHGVEKAFIVTPDFFTDESIVTPNIIAAAKAAGTVKQIVRLIAIPPGVTAETLGPEFLATQCGANLHVIAKPLLDASGITMTYLNAACWIMFNIPWFIGIDVKEHREIAMPLSSDAARLHISEQDIAEVAAKILSEDVALHAGKEYLLTGTQHYDYKQLAALFSEVIGEEVRYVDDDRILKRVMGDNAATLATYFRHETVDYAHVPITDTVEQLLGRPATSVRDYLTVRKDLFV